MRRQEKEIADIKDIESIIRRSSVCRLALCNDGTPYIVPMCFGYDDRKLYFHSATEGLKLDLIRRNPKVCFEFDIDLELIPNENNCSIGMKYRSVIGFGTAIIIEDADEIKACLDVIIRQYGSEPSPYPVEIIRKITVIRIDIESMSGKKSGY
ncbi:MAG: pyridoxamine 5'-phosphate oxidase family protein [Armatimonadota bacterium]